MRYKSKEFWVNLFTEKHGYKYDYSLLPSVVSLRRKAPIICRSHGVIFQMLEDHESKGCPLCTKDAKSEQLRQVYEAHKARVQSQLKRSVTKSCDLILGHMISAVTYQRGTNYDSLLGYTLPEFSVRIANQLPNGIRWADTDAWRIERVVSVEQFVEQGVVEPATINALYNLRVTAR